MADDHDHDAAGIAALRNVLAMAERESRASQGQLQSATAKFNAVSQQVVSLVGGSAQGVDKELVDSLEQAIRHTTNAISSLGSAASASRSS